MRARRIPTVAGLLAVLAGCGGEAPSAVIDEARRDLPQIEAALAAFFDEHQQFPATLDELALPDGVATIEAESDRQFTYAYNPLGPGRTAGPPLCRYDLWVSGDSAFGEGSGDNTADEMRQADRCS